MATTSIARNPIKERYLLARAQYELMAAEASAAFAAIADDDPEQEAKWDALDERYPTFRLFDAMREAEDAIVGWAKQRVTSDPATARKFAANRADLDKLFGSYRRYPNIAAKLIDACMRLED